MTSKEVRKIRESLGMTRPDFAKALGASTRSIEAWETKTKPGNGTIAAIRLLAQVRTPAAQPLTA